MGIQYFKILDAHPLWHHWRWAKQKISSFILLVLYYESTRPLTNVFNIWHGTKEACEALWVVLLCLPASVWGSEWLFNSSMHMYSGVSVSVSESIRHKPSLEQLSEKMSFWDESSNARPFRLKKMMVWFTSIRFVLFLYKLYHNLWFIHSSICMKRLFRKLL